MVLLAVLVTATVPAFASKTSSASGSFTDVAVLNTTSTFIDGNLVYDQANAGVISGTFSGSYVTYVHLTLDPHTGYAVYQALDVCTCKVGGKSGTLYFYEEGTITQFVLLSSTATIVDGTNHLAKLHGSISLQGIVYDAQGLTEGTYAGNVWSGKSAER